MSNVMDVMCELVSDHLNAIAFDRKVRDCDGRVVAIAAACFSHETSNDPIDECGLDLMVFDADGEPIGDPLWFAFDHDFDAMVDAIEDHVAEDHASAERIGKASGLFFVDDD